MRTIKFRAKHEGEWRYYSLWQLVQGETQTSEYCDEMPDDDTWGQYTGLEDKNGKEIYEGDILYWDGSTIGAVSFEYAEFIIGEGTSTRALCAAPVEEIEIIGNIHETPELLQEAKGLYTKYCGDCKHRAKLQSQAWCIKKEIDLFLFHHDCKEWSQSDE